MCVTQNKYSSHFARKCPTESNMNVGEALHSNLSHPVLRDWQQLDLEIAAKHLMYPVFLM